MSEHSHHHEHTEERSGETYVHDRREPQHEHLKTDLRLIDQIRVHRYAMKRVPDLIEGSRYAGDLLNAALNDHERVVHDNTRCGKERANALAYIAHRIGFDLLGDDFAVFIERVEQYRADHIAKEGTDGST